QSNGTLRIVPEFAGESRTTTLRVIDVSLDLAGCDRRGCQRSVGKGDGVPRVFPTLILDSGFFVPTLVLNIAITVAVAILIDPSKCCPGFRFEFSDQVGPSRPTFEFVQQNQEQRSCIR